MAGPRGFSNYLVNELHQDVQNIQVVILDIAVKTGINTPRIYSRYSY